VAGDTALLTGIFTTPSAGVNKSASVALTGNDAPNYNLTPPIGFLYANISSSLLTLSVTISNASKIYGSAVNLGSTTSFTATGLLPGDSISYINLGSNGTPASANVGNYAILASPVFSTSNVGSYTFINPPSGYATLTVNPYTINSLSGNRVYNATTAMNGSAFGAFAGVNGETLTLTGSGSVLSKNVGTGKAVTLGTLALANGTGLASNYILSGTGTYTASITAANLAVTGVTATNKVYDATTSVTLGGTAKITPLGTDAVTLGGTGSGVFADKNAGTAKAVVVSGYTISGADAANYTLVQPASVTANITQKALTWSGTPLAAGRAYDATLTTTVSGATLAGVIAGDAVGLGGLLADPNVGIAKPVSLALTGIDGGNYSIIQPVPGMTATITPRSLSVTADNKFMMFGGTIPPLTYTVGGSGLAGVDTIASVFTGSLAVNITGVLAGSTTPITQGTLVLTGGAGGNYAISLFVNGVMTVQ
jgi:YDG domain/MBG domain (YGX type)